MEARLAFEHNEEHPTLVLCTRWPATWVHQYSAKAAPLPEALLNVADVAFDLGLVYVFNYTRQQRFGVVPV